MARALWLLLLLMAYIGLGGCDPSCDYASLPASLDGEAYLGFNGETRLFSRFAPQVDKTQESVTFTVDEPYFFRLYFAPSYVEANIILNSVGLEPVSYLNTGLSLAASLNEGSYSIDFFYEREIPAGSGRCASILLEVELVPQALMNSRILSANCPSVNLLPPDGFISDLVESSSGAGHYQEGGFIVAAPLAAYNDVVGVQSYRFSIPDGETWTFRFSIGYHFLTGGSLSLILAPDSASLNECLDGSRWCPTAIPVEGNANSCSGTISTGVYQLWIVDLAGTRNRALNSCTEFALEIDMIKHSTVNEIPCPYPELSGSLNDPGFIDSSGFLSMGGYFLVPPDTSTVASVVFEIEHTSTFRAYLRRPELDLDMSLRRKGEPSIIASSYADPGMDEGIWTSLMNGEYELTITRPDLVLERRCSAFHFQLAIIAQQDVSVECNGNVQPDFSDLQDSLNSSGGYLLEKQDAVYTHGYNDYQTGAIFTQEFTISSQSRLVIDVEMNFAIGDLMLQFEPFDDNTTPVLHMGNRILLNLLLDPGTYQFGLEQAVVRNVVDDSALPECLHYAISVLILRDYETDATPCYNVIDLPHSLASPIYLNSANSLHLKGNFLAPGPVHVYSVMYDTVLLRVEKASILRVSLENTPTLASLSLVELDEGGNPGETLVGEVTSLVTILDHNVSYHLIVQFSSESGVLRDCETFAFELYVGPAVPPEPIECSNVLPDSRFFSYTSLPARKSGQFSLLQGSDAFNETVATFSLTESVRFSCKLQQTFLYSNVQLLINGVEADSALQILQPGDYRVTIFDPTQPFELQQQCISFTVDALFRKIDQAPCEGLVLPSSLNNIQYLSIWTGYSTHFVRNSAISSALEGDDIEVLLEADSLLSIMSDSGSVLATFFCSSGHSETGSLISAYLESGYCTINFHSANSTPACEAFSFEVSIVPESSIPINTPFEMPCSLVEPMEVLHIGDSYEIQHYHTPVSTENYHHVIAITTVEEATLAASLFHSMVLGGFQMYLSLSTDSGGPTLSNAVRYSTLAPGELSLYEILAPGSYTLNIVGFASGSMSCNIYEFGASLQATSTGTTAECPENVQWPSDLYTRSGGSQVFGGPISNGTLHFHAFPFLAESQLTQIAFKVEEESVVFIRVDSVWIDRIHGTLQVLGESSEPMVTAHLDNAISLMVSNTDTVYTISLNVVSVNSNPGECLYFGLQVDIEPYQAALDDLRCGDGTLDMISETLSVSSTQSVSHIAGVEVTGGQWSQLIHLTSSSNFTAFIFVDYWAVSEDVSLEIVQGEAVQRASPESVDQGKWSSRAVIGPTMFPPGDYTVHIAVSRSDILPDAQQGDCLSFFYGLQASSDRSPHINQITPFEGTSLQRDRDLVVLLQFSEPVGVPTPSDLTSTVLENRAIVLYANAVSILPESVRFFGDIAVEARFNQSRLVNVRDCQLHVDPTVFANKHSVAFTSPVSDLHYSFDVCDCTGHGSCEDSSAICTCDAPYVGDHCDRCDVGYHLYNRRCIPNLVPTQYTCNEHGQLVNDSDSNPYCVCDPGYVTFGDHYCARCAAGFGPGFPDCSPLTDAQEQPISCSAPLLPSTLDTLRYMSYDESVHISDLFYANLKQGYHLMNFSLEDESVVHIFTQRSEVAATMTLYRSDGNVVAEAVMDCDNVLFETIQSGSYVIQFDFVLVEDLFNGQCPTVYIQLFVASVNQIRSSLSELDGTACQELYDNYPLASYGHWTGGSEDPPPIHLNSSWHPVMEPSYAIDPTSPRLFFQFEFIAEVSTNYDTKIRIETRYDFAVGQVEVLLSRNRSEDCQASCARSESLCVAGTNFFNSHVLEASVQQGEVYTAYLSLSNVQDTALAGCVEYSLTISLDYHPRATGLSGLCHDFELLPPTFDSEQYIGANGVGHFKRSFLLESDRSVSFTANEDSVFRVAAKSPSPLILLVVHDSGSVLTSVSGQGERLEALLSLPVGRYQLVLQPEIAYNAVVGNCPHLDLEFAIAPAEAIARRTCASNMDHVPTLEIIAPPYFFGSNGLNDYQPQTFTAQYSAHTDGFIMTTRFSVNQQSIFEGYVYSDFLTADILMLIRQDQVPIATGKTGYNMDRVQIILAPGNYTMDILFSDRNTFEYGNCSDFNFGVSLVTYTDVATSCHLVDGEPLPNSLNSQRYLGEKGFTHYQSDSWRMPYEDRYHDIYFHVDRDSLLRVYLQPSAVDIDVFLAANYDEASNEESDWLVVARSSDGRIYEEESLVSSLLHPGTRYRLRLEFILWDATFRQCPLFNMEFAVGFPEALAPLCPDRGSSSWPVIDTIPQIPYLLANDHLYFQQQVSAVTHTLHFQTSTNAQLFIRTDFDFLTGDLSFVVTDENGAQFYGYHNGDRSSLLVPVLKPGEYTLTIYEPAAPPSTTRGCSIFGFIFSLRPIDSEDVSAFVPYPSLPDSLSGVGLLGYNDQVHFQGTYHLFQLDMTQTMLVTAKDEDIVLRVSAYQNGGGQRSVIVLSVADTADNRVIVSDTSQVAAVLPAPNSYLISMSMASKAKHRNPAPVRFTSNFQLSVAPQRRTKEIQESWEDTLDPDCTTSLFPFIVVYSGDVYQFHSAEMLIHSNDLQNPTITTTSISLPQRSFISVIVGFRYLLTELAIQIEGQGLTVHSDQQLNGAMLKKAFPRGDYEITLLNPTHSDLDLVNCGSYTLDIVIEPAPISFDCSAYRDIPLDLNEPSTEVYGGPIDNDGYLRFLGNEFLIPMPPRLPATSLDLTITQPSIIWVYTASDVAWISGIGHALLDSNGVIIPPLTEHAQSGVHGSWFDVTPNASNETFVLALAFEGVTTASACPFITLAIDIAPKTSLNSVYSCDLSGVPSNSVSAPLGVASQSVRGGYPGNEISQVFSISLDLRNASQITIVLAYNPFVSFFGVSIDSDDETVFGMPMQAFLSAEVDNTDDLLASAKLTAKLDPALYTVSIRSSLLDTSVVAAEVCVPYSWNLQIVPADSTSPYVLGVDPANIYDFPQDEDLVVIVSLSELLYAETVPVVGEQNVGMLNGFFLRTSSPIQIVSPFSADQIDDAARVWKLAFAGRDLQHGHSYQLALHDGILTNVDGSQLLMPVTYSYRILPDCSENQHLYESECVCNSGFQDPDCTSCLPGLQLPDCTPIMPFNCSRCLPHGHCDDRNATCVCDNHWDGTFCKECANRFSGENCDECSGQFAGNDCDDCKLGFQGVQCDRCAPHFSPPLCNSCVYPWQRNRNGDCSICPPQFSGAQCDHCAMGYSGNDCSECAPHFAGFDCSDCASHWSGTRCDVCESPFTGVDCDECMAPFAGDNCDQCLGHFAAPTCDSCALGWAGDECDHCDDHFQGTNCSECKNHWSGSKCDTCLPPFTGHDCDQCVSPFSGPMCNACEGNFAPPDCVACKGNFEGPSCTSCLPHWTGDECNSCDDHFTGPDCDQCVEGWAGDQCDYCDDHFQGTSCSECKNHWSGSKCDTCLPPFTGHDCDQCVSPFSGPMCNACEGNFAPPDCVACKGNFEGPSCTSCLPHWTGDECNSCDDHFTGPDCDQCVEGWAGDACDRCAPHFTGLDCDTCEGHWTGPSCATCPFPFLATGDSCRECQPPFTGADCNLCLGRYTGPDCSSCLPGWGPPDCNACAPHFSGNLCDICDVGWDGPDCSDCATNFQGKDCNQCRQYFTGPLCLQCQPNRQGEDCTECKINWAGQDCSQCADGFTGNNCDPEEESGWLTALKITGIVIGLLAIILSITIFVVWRVRQTGKSMRGRYMPVLDLDEDDDAVELDVNPVIVGQAEHVWPEMDTSLGTEPFDGHHDHFSEGELDEEAMEEDAEEIDLNAANTTLGRLSDDDGTTEDEEGDTFDHFL